MRCKGSSKLENKGLYMRVTLRPFRRPVKVVFIEKNMLLSFFWETMYLGFARPLPKKYLRIIK